MFTATLFVKEKDWTPKWPSKWKWINSGISDKNGYERNAAKHKTKKKKHKTATQNSMDES